MEHAKEARGAWGGVTFVSAGLSYAHEANETSFSVSGRGRINQTTWENVTTASAPENLTAHTERSNNSCVTRL